MLKELSITPWDLPLAQPFAYATVTLNSLPYALVKLTDKDGNTGYGEVAAAWDVTGETAGSAVALAEYLWPLLQNRSLNSLDDIRTILADVNREIAGNPATKAGLEEALFDLLGHRTGQNVLDFFGVSPRPIRSQTILSFQDFDAFRSGEYPPQPPVALKVKMGRDFNRELEVLNQARSRYPDLPLSADVNQGWKTAVEAIQYAKQLESLKLNWLEQPLPAGALTDAQELVRATAIPIMLDESVKNRTDAELWIGAGAGTMVNIKLAKTGGLLAAVELAAWCDAHNVPYMIGDMLHSQLGSVMNLYAGALTHPRIHDVMRPDRIPNDPTSGISFDGSGYRPPVGPGLGITWKSVVLTGS